MGSVAFDTLKAAKRLGEAGFEPEQAEALVSTFAGELNDNLATKDDLERIEERLDTKIDTVEERLSAEIKAVDQKIDGVKKALEAKIDAVDEKLDSVKETLDTKIDSVKETLDTKIDSVKETLETKIESASRNTIIWLGGAIIAAATILGALDRIFPPPG